VSKPRGLDRAKTARTDRDAHRERLARARARGGEPLTPRELLLDVLFGGLGELATLRRRYGAHRDFDLVETHQRKLIAELEASDA